MPSMLYAFPSKARLPVAFPMPVMGVKECLPWGYRRHWNEVWEISEQVIEGIPVFSPDNFKVGDGDR
jgi:hypothetical protein